VIFLKAMINTKIDSIVTIPFSQIQNSGDLTVFPITKTGTQIPVKRIFTISNVPVGGFRGNHAHKYCSQLVVCLNGSIELEITDGTDKKLFTLSSAKNGILIPPGLWNKLKFLTPDSVLMVLCDELYDPEDYIRDWDEFMNIKMSNTE
jgi:dTDP-4-dehydrorhamnose 3,5-epimerase-like enzyme